MISPVRYMYRKTAAKVSIETDAAFSYPKTNLNSFISPTNIFQPHKTLSTIVLLSCGNKEGASQSSEGLRTA